MKIWILWNLDMANHNQFQIRVGYLLFLHIENYCLHLGFSLAMFALNVKIYVFFLFPIHFQNSNQES